MQGNVSILVGRINLAKAIVCTDGDDATLEGLRRNVEDADNGEGTPVHVAKLYWGDNVNAFMQSCQPLIAQSSSDEAQLLTRFDTVLGADIIYEEQQVAPLIDTVATIMAEAGEFLLAFARRNVPIARVFEYAATGGLDAEHGIRRPMTWTILDDGAVEGQQEPIYRFVFAGK